MLQENKEILANSPAIDPRGPVADRVMPWVPMPSRNAEHAAFLSTESLDQCVGGLPDQGSAAESAHPRWSSLTLSEPVSGPAAEFVAHCDNSPSKIDVQHHWSLLRSGLEQRFEAVNRFLTDVLTDGHIPEFVLRHSSAMKFLRSQPRSLQGLRPGIGKWTWLASTDIYVSGDGEFLILDHNFSCPTGFEKLAGLLRTRSDGLLRDGHDPVASWLEGRMQFGWCGLEGNSDRLRTAVLTTGSFHPEQSEHNYLTSHLGAAAVRNRDVILRPDGLYLNQSGHPERIDILVRRVDDDLLDPNCYRPDSLIGVPGMVKACRESSLCVLNSPGTGIMNNRAIGVLIPEMIRHYLKESPILDSATTLICADEADRGMVLSHLDRYSVRTIDPQHPRRPFFGSSSGKAETAELTSSLLRNPHHYVARPLIEDWSRAVEGCAAGYNLRVFAGISEKFDMLPAGIGRACQPDGGATLAIANDSTAFLVNMSGEG
ncbi:MAG: circularly permuted type 2 ATP-grasp protein [Planctomyces sp.]